MDLQFTSSPYAAIAYVTRYVTKDEREVGTVLQAVSREMRYHGVNEQMKKVAYAFSNARNISAQEQHIESLDFLYTNQISQLYGFVVVFLKTESILKPKEQLDALDDEDEDVFLLPTSWTDIQLDQTL